MQYTSGQLQGEREADCVTDDAFALQSAKQLTTLMTS